MTLELWTLLAAALLSLIHMTSASFTFKAQVGNRYTVGPRDENLQPTGWQVDCSGRSKTFWRHSRSSSRTFYWSI